MNARRYFAQKLLSCGIALGFLIGMLPTAGQAGKAEFSVQMFCDADVGGPQYAGCVKLNRTGRFTAKLSGLPLETVMSCYLDCGLSGASIDIPNCGVTDEHGNLNISFPGLGADFGASCVGLQVSVYALGAVSCTQGFAAGACDRFLKNDNGTIYVTCKSVNCPNPCTVHLINTSNGNETDTGLKTALVPPGSIGVCPCN